MTFIILDETNGVPLSGNQAVRRLTDSGSQTALTAAGLTAEAFMTSGKRQISNTCT